MELALAEQLNQINRDFYTRFAAAFAESRSLNQPSLRRILACVPPAGKVLDVGCGHGRMAHMLDSDRPGASYLGLDFSQALVELARQATERLASIKVRFVCADITQPSWSAVLAGRAFDTIYLLAVLHHVPGFDNRVAILRSLREHLDPHGRLVMSAWQFLSHERMRRKIVPWAQVGLDPANLEPGDYVMDWKRGGLGFRYCHLIDQPEMERLAAGAGYWLETSFRADGKEGDLSLFSVLAPGVS